MRHDLKSKSAPCETMSICVLRLVWMPLLLPCRSRAVCALPALST